MRDTSRMLWLLAGSVPLSRAAIVQKPSCDAQIKLAGEHGSEKTFIIPTGWKNKDGYAEVPVEKDVIAPQLGGRAYFADSCTAGKYNNTDYARPNLLGKTMRFSTHLAGAGCGCNAAFYLTSMGHNEKASECFDHYCDANDVCGCSCAEIDIMEANQHAWHSTLHTKTDTDGAASGFGGGGDGWNGPRNWTAKEYGINGSCIETAKPFDVAVSFPIDKHGVLEAMQITLSQKSHDCKLQARVDNYAKGMKELTHALLDGMTPIISYWSDDSMTWMDGLGGDGKGPCKVDHADKCADSVKFWDFKVDDLDQNEQKVLAKDARDFDKEMEKQHPDSHNRHDGNDWWGKQDSNSNKDDSSGNQDGGNQWWHPEDDKEKDKDGSDYDGGNQGWHPEEGSSEGQEDVGNQWWHPDGDKDGEKTKESNAQDGGNQWWHPEDSNKEQNKDAGNQWWHPDESPPDSNKSDAKQRKGDAVVGSDNWDGKASSGSERWNDHDDRNNRSEGNNRSDWNSQGDNQWQKTAWEDDDKNSQHSESDQSGWDTQQIPEQIIMRKSEEVGNLRGAAGPGASGIGALIGAAAVGGVIMAASMALFFRRRTTQRGPTEAGVGSLATSSLSSSGGSGAALRFLRNSLSSGDLMMHEMANSSPTPMLQQPASSLNLLAMDNTDQAA